MKRLILFKSVGAEASPDPHIVSYYRVLASSPVSPRGGRDECWMVEYDEGTLVDPAADPLVVGVAADATFILWREAVWRPATAPQMEVLYALAGLGRST